MMFVTETKQLFLPNTCNGYVHTIRDIKSHLKFSLLNAVPKLGIFYKPQLR